MSHTKVNAGDYICQNENFLHYNIQCVLNPLRKIFNIFLKKQNDLSLNDLEKNIIIGYFP